MSPRPQLERDGVCIHPTTLTETSVELLRGCFDEFENGAAGARTFDRPQILLDLIGPNGPVGNIAKSLSGDGVRPVRLILFDKTPAANWAVPWHQDRTIAVDRRASLEGYGPWTVKGHAVHVEPPVSVLQGMLTLRMFLDDCGDDDGPLRVALGSHRHGRVPGDRIAEVVNRSEIYTAVGRTGEVLAMRTLAIHSSKRAVTPSHRRVVHVDYSSFELPAPLQWRMC